MSFLGKFLGILVFQAMVTVAKRIVNFFLSFLNNKERDLTKRAGQYQNQAFSI